MNPRTWVREIRIPAHGERQYRPEEWRDALVFVQSGELELITLGNVRRRFSLGSILFLANLRLLALCNPGVVPTVLSTVARSRSARGAGQTPRGWDLTWSSP